MNLIKVYVSRHKAEFYVLIFTFIIIVYLLISTGVIMLQPLMSASVAILV